MYALEAKAEVEICKMLPTVLPPENFAVGAAALNSLQVIVFILAIPRELKPVSPSMHRNCWEIYFGCSIYRLNSRYSA
jgi:hypothetical protein